MFSVALLVGAAGTVLYTAWARGWPRDFWSYLQHRAGRMQSLVPVRQAGAESQSETPFSLPSPGTKTLGLEDLGPLVTQRSFEHEQVGMALERLLGSLPRELFGQKRVAGPISSVGCTLSPFPS